MRFTLLCSALLATATAAPFVIRDTWAPLAGTTAKCGDREKYMSLVIGPENGESVPKHSCAAFMPACAYPAENNLSNNTVCTGVDVYPIDGPKNVTLPVLVESDGKKLSGWAVNFFVVPKAKEGDFPVQWSKADCEGYINELITQTDPKGCYIPGTGPGAGNLTIGAPTEGTGVLTGKSVLAGKNVLAGTLVGAQIVKK
ncbi:hypothetical protein P280DRAFT_414176 [Massarina eburnea CBS 473.64]|uniref:Uncharacterized protein n=1 Tax=Massarina eburnea CBS 473.64 TaxID=1395130 RepID=A0A6A6RJK2_9PLEO|nr:hypothetical protein P280DRAFT_414176 [Massarina eburnea CBS 473.64]